MQRNFNWSVLPLCCFCLKGHRVVLGKGNSNQITKIMFIITYSRLLIFYFVCQDKLNKQALPVFMTE